MKVVRESRWESNWEFWSSFLFSTTIATTIGYGHITPNTNAGKLICIVFGLISIPMTITLMSAVVVAVLRKLMFALEKRLMAIASRIYSPSLLQIRILQFVITTLLILIVFFIFPAILLNYNQNWNFLDAIYYCFISLTAVGLGDFVPDLEYANWIKIISNYCYLRFDEIFNCFLQL